jgi:transcriptional regulator with XRE-family HTH domain
MLALIVSKREATENEDLSAYIIRICKEKNLTSQDIETNAERMGRKVARSHISRLISGGSGNPTIESIRAIADGLGEPIEDVIKAAFNIGKDQNIERKIRLRQEIWDNLDEDATRCQRTTEEQLAAILIKLYKLGNIELGEIERVNKKVALETWGKAMGKTVNPREVQKKLQADGVNVDLETVFTVLYEPSAESAGIDETLKKRILETAGLLAESTIANG